MEPAGIMNSDCSLENFTKQRQLDQQQQQHEYNLCDLADEEVHFSRPEVLIGKPTSMHLEDTFYESTRYKSNDSKSYSYTLQQNLPPFADVELGFYHHARGSSADSSREQVQSNKLLNRIGSRLRRGSNYLIVPKLVGHYLLGITVQNWSEFLNTNRMTKPPSNTNLWTRRLFSNLSHFQGNYLCVSLVLVFYCILSSPFLLLAIIAYLAALYSVTSRSATGKHLRIIGYRPNLQQQYSFITLISLPLLWVAGAPSAVFWVIGASFVVVGLHASLYNQEQVMAFNSITELPAVSQVKLTSYPSSRNKSVQYNDHYSMASAALPGQQQQQHYLPIPSSPCPLVEPMNFSQTNNNNKPPAWYTSSLTQWINFGSNSGNTKIPRQKLNSHSNQQRVPDVTIISQDYAGLGRVYEI